MTTEEGFTSPEVVAAAGISYRQLDYWSWKGYVQPSIQPAKGYGSVRRYSLDDAVTVTIVSSLAKLGVAIDMAVNIAAQAVTDNGTIGYTIGPVSLEIDVAKVRADVSKTLGVEEESDGETR